MTAERPSWFGSISIAQVEALETMFATLSATGWVIPEWLVYLRSQVEARDIAAGPAQA